MTNRHLGIVVALGIAAILTAPAAASGRTVVIGGQTPTGIAAPQGGQIEGEMADCLDQSEANGLGPKSALNACMQLVLTPDNGTVNWPADPDPTD